MEVRSEGLHVRSEKNLAHGVLNRARSRVWFLRVCSSILLWTCLIQLIAVGQLWRPRILNGLSNPWSQMTNLHSSSTPEAAPLPPPFPPSRIYRSNGFLKVSCNGGLNQMRAAICDMVTVARLLNLTLIVPELDKASFWADSSNFEDIFDVDHFIGSLRDEIKIIKKLPKSMNRKLEYRPLVMPPVSWSNENYYLKQILPLFDTYKVIHFNKTDTRLANNGISPYLQKLRCRVNFDALKFAPPIESLGLKLVKILTQRGPFVALHLRYEMDMLAFSGCTHGCTQVEADELKQMRYMFPWWREKEIVSEERRAQGLCPLTPEETALILRALGFREDTQIYIASGEIYGKEKRLSALRTAFPLIVKKETVLEGEELRKFENHSSQMAALDFIVSIYSNVFIPTYYGNMARLVEGHRRYLGFRKNIILKRKKLVELVDLNHNQTLSWDAFVSAVQLLHRSNTGHPRLRNVISDRPKDEDYFYSNPHECLCPFSNSTTL